MLNMLTKEITMTIHTLNKNETFMFCYNVRTSRESHRELKDIFEFISDMSSWEHES